MCGKDNPDMGEEVKEEKSVEDMVCTRFHKYLSVFKKKEFEHLPLHKLWDHGIKTKSGFQLKKSKVYALSPKEQEEVDDFINEQLRKDIYDPQNHHKHHQYFLFQKKIIKKECAQITII